MFVDWFELYYDFTTLSTKKKEVKEKCNYKRATQEKKERKNQKLLHPLCPLYFDICLASLNLCWEYV
jgi:hypothetical protein